ncbi:MAG: secretin N-terminal domain-containing protein [Phycisphaerales bacterium]
MTTLRPSSAPMPLQRGVIGVALCLTALAGTAFGQTGEPARAAPAETSAMSEDSNINVSEYLTVDIFVQDEELANVLQMLSVQSRRNIVASKDVSATVTANLYGVTFYEALDSILNVNGYGYIERGNFIYVHTLEELAVIQEQERQIVSRVIQLNYLNANDAAEFVAPLLSEAGVIKTNGDAGDFSLPEEAPTGNEQFALAATLVIYDYDEHIEEIESLLAQLDTRPAQVLVEATILQTEINEANAFGVDFSILNDVDFTDFIGLGGPLDAASALIGGDGGFAPADNKAGAFTSTPGNTAGPATFRLGVVENDVSVFLRALDEVTDVTILSTPKLLTLNRQPARVLVGRKLGFLNTTSTQTATTQTVEFLDTGTQLAFRPFISRDGNIRLELKPRVSEGVIRTATDATGAAVTIPDEITQEITTNLIVRDGSTVVLGGLFRESTSLSRSQVPVLGDIPVIGAAFRGHDDETSRSEIIFMVKPTIVNDQILSEQGDRALDHAERLRVGSRQGLLPFSRDRQTARLNLAAEQLARDGDMEKALWNIRRSLELNPVQPSALQLLEKLTEGSVRWPIRSALEQISHGYIDGYLAAKADESQPDVQLRESESFEFLLVPMKPEEEETDVTADANVEPLPHDGSYVSNFDLIAWVDGLLRDMKDPPAIATVDDFEEK